MDCSHPDQLGDHSNTYWSRAERDAAVYSSLLAWRCGGWLIPRYRSVHDVLVPASRTSADDRDVYGCRAYLEYVGRSGFRGDPGSRSLADDQQLAVASHPGRLACC